MAKTYVAATINGESSEFLCETQQTLLDVLRDVIGLTGSKEGCASGDCGACSVIMDGRLVCSCLVLGVEAEGTSITTIEGIAQDVQQGLLGLAEEFGLFTVDGGGYVSLGHSQ